jgi:hypothetical protein
MREAYGLEVATAQATGGIVEKCHTEVISESIADL